MDKQEVFAIDWGKYLNPDRQRPSGTHASIDWDYRKQFESDLGQDHIFSGK